MTRVDFHLNVPDKIAYACRLVRKIRRAGRQAVVWCDDPVRLREFDTALWAFSPREFIPHVMASDRLAARTPVLLTGSDGDLPHHDVLLNLADEWPPFFATFDRLLEIVGMDEPDKELARARYVFYQKRGYDIRVNDIEGERR